MVQEVIRALLLFYSYFMAPALGQALFYNSDPWEEMTCSQGEQINKEAKRSFLEYALKMDRHKEIEGAEGGCGLK